MDLCAIFIFVNLDRNKSNFAAISYSYHSVHTLKFPYWANNKFWGLRRNIYLSEDRSEYFFPTWWVVSLMLIVDYVVNNKKVVHMWQYEANEDVRHCSKLPATIGIYPYALVPTYLHILLLGCMQLNFDNLKIFRWPRNWLTLHLLEHTTTIQNK